ncbi:MAG TPA: hypothetical protein VH134_12250 [Candidatus Dormibacteraeota bacterium]|jgi:hypothetical protein|nr:hypothetical protein [Candidatus Dormibacteraeota bacterium]
MSQWRRVELYTTFLRLSGELEGPAEQRLTDLVAECGPVLELRGAVVDPALDNARALIAADGERRLSAVRSAITLVCPRDQAGETARHREGWTEKLRLPVQLHASAFSMLGEVHLEPGAGLAELLCDGDAGFVPVTNFSALWFAGAGEPRAVQRGFALVNCAHLVGFGPAPPR